MRKLGKLDLFPNTKESHNVRTISGGLNSNDYQVTIFSLIVVVILLLSEFSSYMTVTVENDLVVDGYREEQLQISFNITFPRLPCAYMSLDALDIAGVAQLDVNSTVYKQRLKKTGKLISNAEAAKLQSEIMKDIELVNVPENTNGCASCYGAETPERQCCPTCEDVRLAYKDKGWSFSSAKNIAQCKNEGYSQRLASQKTEGCRIYGSIDVGKVGGNFHISPGKSFTAGHSHLHDTSNFDYNEKFDLSHTIHKLAFGEYYPGKYSPLDGMVKETTATNSLYQYFIKVVSTSYTDVTGQNLSTNQYSVTQHYQAIDNLSTDHDNHGYPGVYFIYDLSPIEVNLVERSQSFASFFTSVCAIIGGIFTIFRILDQFVYQSVRSFTHKEEMGKIS